MFEETQLKTSTRIADTVGSDRRGKAISLSTMFGKSFANRFLDSNPNRIKVHDANFAFLSTNLAKLHNKEYAPKSNITYGKDIYVDAGGGFVDYIEYMTINYSGMMNEFRNLFGNQGNVIPRVNAGMNQKIGKVYTFEVGYDLKFVEMEKMTKLKLKKSLEDIYKNAIIVGWDFFCEKVAYEGMNGGTGLFNSKTVKVEMIDNSKSTYNHKGFKGLDDATIVSWLNGMFERYLEESNMNQGIVPNRILVPTFVGADLTGRFSELYTSTLRKFITDHNLLVDETDGQEKLVIQSRPRLNNAGKLGFGRIVCYRNEPDYVRIDMPYPVQHYITRPNIDKACYTSIFVGQISEVQMPYNETAEEIGIVSYWDFSK